MSTRPTGRWVRSDAVLWRTLPDGVLLFPPGAASPLAVRGSASRIWHLLAVPRTTDDLVSTLVAESGTDREVVAHDVGELTASLAEAIAIQADATS
jgi:hypothetical protein